MPVGSRWESAPRSGPKHQRAGRGGDLRIQAGILAEGPRHGAQCRMIAAQQQPSRQGTQDWRGAGQQGQVSARCSLWRQGMAGAGTLQQPVAAAIQTQHGMFSTALVGAQPGCQAQVFRRQGGQRPAQGRSQRQPVFDGQRGGGQGQYLGIGGRGRLWAEFLVIQCVIVRAHAVRCHFGAYLHQPLHGRGAGRQHQAPTDEGTGGQGQRQGRAVAERIVQQRTAHQQQRVEVADLPIGTDHATGQALRKPQQLGTPSVAAQQGQAHAVGGDVQAGAQARAAVVGKKGEPVMPKLSCQGKHGLSSGARTAGIEET